MTKVVIIGEIYNAGLEIGGGPIIPPAQPPLGIWGPPQMPPGIWPSPPSPRPEPPLGIWGPPQMPPGIWPSPGGSRPVDPGWSGGVAPPNVIGGGPIYPPTSPPGYWGGGPHPTPPIYIPAQPVLPDSGDPTKAHLIVYVPGVGAVSFTVDLTTLPEPAPPPTEPEPKPA